MGTCKQCGFKIIDGSASYFISEAHKAGFCSAGCKEVYAKLKEWAYRAAGVRP